MALRTIKANAEKRKEPVFAHFEKVNRESIKSDYINVNLNDIMENLGIPQFTYDSFKVSYDNNPQIQELIDNFSSEGITINSDESTDLPKSGDGDSNTVSNMAKAATDLSDNLG